LNALSLQEAQAFVILMESLVKIVELTPPNVKNSIIEIKEGSACVAVMGENVAAIMDDYRKIDDNNKSDLAVL
jgi:hypothetical protein